MKILYVLHPKSKVVNWQRSGDTNMATRLLKRFPADVEVDVAADFSGLTEEQKELVQKHFNITNLVDMHDYIQKRTYLKHSMEYIASIAPRYDLVHFHNATVTTGNYIYKLFNNLGVPVLYTMHTPPDSGRAFSHYYGDDYRAITLHPNMRLVAVSPSHEKRVRDTLGNVDMPNLIHILNGIEVDIPVEFKKSPEECQYDVVVVGRLDASKDILHALKAARTCSSTGKVVYVGDNWAGSTSTQDDDYYNETVKFIQESGIIWYKSVPNSSVYQIMADSKCHIALSRIETYGLTVAESMVCGTPVIGFNDGGIGDLISDGLTGKFIPKSRTIWKNRYKTIAELYKECLGIDRSNIATIAKARFNIDRTAKEYLELYKSLVEVKKDDI